MTTRLLADLSAPEAQHRVTESSVLIQPIAAIEQHGAHLPLSTDLLIAQALTEAVTAERGDELDLWLLPPLAYGKSNEHAWSAGTVWLSELTLLAVLEDVGRSLASLAANRLVFVNSHGGNTALLDVACRELRLAHGLMTFVLQYWAATPAGPGPDDTELGMGIHCGRDETSLVLHLRPDLVDMTRAERHVPEHLAANRHVRFGGSVGFGWLSDDFGPTGVIGDPTAASPERGKALFEAAVAYAGDALAEIRFFSFRPIGGTDGPGGAT